LKYRGTVILTRKMVLRGRKTVCFDIVMRYKAERLIPLSSTTGRISLDFPWEIWPAFLFPILFPYFLRCMGDWTERTRAIIWRRVFAPVRIL
jgi:hypothetical protein